MSSTVELQPSSFTEEKFAIVSGLMIATDHWILSKRTISELGINISL